METRQITIHHWLHLPVFAPSFLFDASGLNLFRCISSVQTLRLIQFCIFKSFSKYTFSSFHFNGQRFRLSRIADTAHTARRSKTPFFRIFHHPVNKHLDLVSITDTYNPLSFSSKLTAVSRVAHVNGPAPFLRHICFANVRWTEGPSGDYDNAFTVTEGGSRGKPVCVLMMMGNIWRVSPAGDKSNKKTTGDLSDIDWRPCVQQDTVIYSVSSGELEGYTDVFMAFMACVTPARVD